MARRLHERVAHALARAGCTHLFGLPGGGPNLDIVGAAASEGIDFVLGHAETSAAIQAATHGLLRSVPTAVIATRGPGAASLINGAAAATLDRFPLVVITDTVSSVDADRVDHQRLDQRALFAPVSKASTTISEHTSDDELDQLLRLATTWPYGAVHLDYDPSGPSDVAAMTRGMATHRAAEHVEAEQLVANAERPLILAGAEAATSRSVQSAMLRSGIPVLSTYQGLGSIPTTNALHSGLFTNGALEADVLDAADCVVAVGLDLVEPIPAQWRSTAPVVRLSSVVAASGYMPVTHDVIGPLEMTASKILGTADGGRNWLVGANAAMRSRLLQEDVAPEPDTVGPLQLVSALADLTPGEATITVDAGAHFLAVMPLWNADRPHQVLISNGLATMGFAVPAAIGASIALPGRPIVAFTGDGGMSMTLAELETLARLELPVTVVVFNDATLSLIKIKQRDHHGGDRAVGYAPVDFASIARASGVAGHVVKSVTTLREQLETRWDRPRLLDVSVDPSVYPQLLAATRG